MNSELIFLQGWQLFKIIDEEVILQKKRRTILDFLRKQDASQKLVDTIGAWKPNNIKQCFANNNETEDLKENIQPKNRVRSNLRTIPNAVIEKEADTTTSDDDAN